MRGTQVKIRHYRHDPEGRGLSLIWAQFGETWSEMFELGEILKGSPADLDVIRNQLWTPNALVDEGEGDILDVYFNDQAVRASTFFRLYNDTAIVETDTLVTLLNEVTGGGYGGSTVTRSADWTEPALDAGDMQTVSTVKTFTATGTWTTANELVLATVVSVVANLDLRSPHSEPSSSPRTSA